MMAARAGRSPAPDPRRRDRPALGLDRLAVPGAQLAARVRGLSARPEPAPRPAPAADPRRRVDRHAALRRPRLRPGRAVVVRSASPAASATGRSRRTAGSRCRCRLHWRRSPPSSPPRTRLASSRSTRRAIFNELSTIFAALPHDQLAVQWDTNFEFAMLDGVMPAWFDDPRSSIVERLVRLGRSIPADVQLGYHFCHGHERHHRERPYDAQALVDIANALSLSLGRSLDWVHLPVQGGRVDVGFFETLAQLALRPETSLYLGLIHPSDGLAGATARVVAAQRFVDEFGVATDCGWSRHRSQDVEPLIELHRDDLDGDRAERTRRTTFAWPARLAAHPRRVVDHRAGRRLRRVVRQRRHAQLVSQSRPDGRGARPPRRRRRHRRRLLGRHRDLRRSTEAAPVRRPGGNRDRRQLAEVPARRHGEVRRRHSRRLAIAALPRRTRSGCSASTRCSATSSSSVASTTSRRPTPIHLYPDLPDTVASWVRTLRPGGQVLVNSGNIRNPRAREQRVDPRRDGVGGRRPRRGTGPQRSRLRRVPARSRRRRADGRPRRLPRPGVPSSAAVGRVPRDASSSPDSRSSRSARRASRRGSPSGTSCWRRTTTPCSGGSAGPRRSMARAPS